MRFGWRPRRDYAVTDRKRAAEVRLYKLRWALLTYWNDHRWLPSDAVYLLDLLHGFGNGRMVLRDGKIEPDRVVIAVSEAVAALGPSKPMSRRWFGTRTGRRRTASASHPHTSVERRESRGHVR